MREGAAGTMYTTYEYKFQSDYLGSVIGGKKVVIFSFTLRFPTCENYDDPRQSACKAERSAFDIDGIVNEMALSIT
jgi:hypothetical protein